MNADASLLDIVNDRLKSKDDFLPVFDSNALKIQREASRRDCDIRTIEKLITRDQALTSQVLKFANSAFYKGLSNVTTVRNAIVRLGTAEIANIVLLASQKSSYRSGDPYFQKIMDLLWRHSMACAIGSHWICKNCQFEELAQEAFFAGLLHDIGKLLVLAVISDAKRSGIVKKDRPVEFVQEVMNALHHEKGHKLMISWSLPEKYAVVARDHHADTYDNGNHLLTIVRLANMVCNKIGLGITPMSDIILAATPEAEAIRLSEIKLAQLEIELEDSMSLS